MSNTQSQDIRLHIEFENGDQRDVNVGERCPQHLEEIRSAIGKMNGRLSEKTRYEVLELLGTDPNGVESVTVLPTSPQSIESPGSAMRRRLDDSPWIDVPSEKQPSPKRDTPHTEEHRRGIQSPTAQTNVLRQSASIVLTGTRRGSHPEKDGGMHDVVTVNTSLGNVALTTGPGVQDDINKDAVGVNQLSDGTIRIVVADGIGKNVGSDTAARLSVESFLQANSMEEAAENSQAQMAELAARERWGDDAGACVSAVSIRRSADGYHVEYAQAGDTQAITVSGSRLQTTGEDNVLGDYNYLNDLYRTGRINPTQMELFDEFRALIEDRGEERCRHIVTRSLSPRQEGTVRRGELHAESGSWVMVFSDGLGDNINLGGLGQALLQEEKEARHAGRTFTATDACEFIKKIAVELSLTDKKDNIAIAVCKLP